MSIAKAELLRLIRCAPRTPGKSYLTYDRFREFAGVPMSQVYRHFDSWADACNAAGVQPGQASPDNLTPRSSKGKNHALRELKRVAAALQTSTLSRSEFDSQRPEVKAQTVAHLWGGWRNALEAAGLDMHPDYRESIPLDVLAQEFLD